MRGWPWPAARAPFAFGGRKGDNERAGSGRKTEGGEKRERASGWEKWSWAESGEKKGREKNSFSFSKYIFQSYFQVEFEFNSNSSQSQSLQKQMCSSMNASTSY